MRLIKEYHTLIYYKFETMTDYIPHIKSFEEFILATNIIPTPDKQTNLCFAIFFPKHLQYLTKLWTVTPDMTAVKATTMLLEEGRQEQKPKDPEDATYILAAIGKKSPCKTCAKLHGLGRWTECPDSAPEWYQDQVANAGTQRKRTESSVPAGMA